MNPLVNKYLQKINQNKIINSFTDLCESHPNYPSLLAISDSLNTLKIENISASIPFQHFKELPNQFLTKLNHIEDFVLLQKSNEKFYIENEDLKSEQITLDNIEQNWNGFVFIIEENEEKQTQVFFENKWLLYSLLILGIVVAKESFNFEKSFYLFTSIIGLFLSSEILKTSYKKDGNESKLCTSNKTISCDSVINSNAFTLTKYIEFSDLPIVFFSISLFGIVFHLFSYQFIGLLSLLSIPIVIYSIYLQKIIIKKWCTLCIMVSAILTLNSITFLVFYKMKFELQEISNLLLTSLLILPFWFVLKKAIKGNLESSQKINKLLRFKRSEKVFDAVTQDISGLEKIDFITIGNINSKNELTLFVTPSCSFCHEAIKDAFLLLDKHEEAICLKIGYNLNSTNTDNPYLKIATITTYLFNNKLDYIQALKDWHVEKLELKTWLKKWDPNVNSIFENETLEKQFVWCTNQNFNYAPVRILNQKLLTEEYEIKELPYFFIE